MRAAEDVVRIMSVDMALSHDSGQGKLLRGSASRADSLLRRPASYRAPAPLLIADNLTVDRETHEVTRAGPKIALNAIEFSLLEILASTPGKPISRARILERDWAYDADSLTNIVDVYISLHAAMLTWITL